MPLSIFSRTLGSVGERGQQSRLVEEWGMGKKDQRTLDVCSSSGSELHSERALWQGRPSVLPYCNLVAPRGGLRWKPKGALNVQSGRSVP